MTQRQPSPRDEERQAHLVPSPVSPETKRIAQRLAQDVARKALDAPAIPATAWMKTPRGDAKVYATWMTTQHCMIVKWTLDHKPAAIGDIERALQDRADEEKRLMAGVVS